MPTHSTLAMILRDILLLTCITAAAAELEWDRLRKEIKYPTAMREAMDAWACTGSSKFWENRLSKLKDRQNQKTYRSVHARHCMRER